MDTRDTAEQAELRRSARQLARELGPPTVADLDDATRRKRLAGAVRDAGWLELRDDQGDGTPLASGVEAAIVADALGSAVADVAFTGPVLARDLVRRAGVEPVDGAVVACAASLVAPASASASVTVTALSYAVDCGAETNAAYVLVPDDGGYRLALVRVEGAGEGADLTRVVRAVAAGTRAVDVAAQGPPLTDADLAGGPRSDSRSRAPISSASCAVCSTSPLRTRRSAGSTACRSGRSKPCSTCSPRPVA